jgi:hypothetical protein
MLRHDAFDFGQLPVILCGALVESHRLLCERKRRRAVAEPVPDLRKQKVRQRVVESFANPRLHKAARLFPVPHTG